MNAFAAVIVSLMQLFAVVAWVFGVALASGFWQIAAAVIVPPYAWVLVAERSLIFWGWM